MRHDRHQGRRTGEHKAPLVSLFPFRKGKVVVLQGKGSCQDVGQMFRGVPHHVLPHGQNQCPMGTNFKLLADHHGIHSRGMGKAVGLHLSTLTPRD